MTLFYVPYPPKQLSPNARLHWAKKFRIAANYRAACYALCKMAKAKAPKNEHPIEVTLGYHAPDHRKRDLDNMLSSSKALLDGVALALGVDDSRFHITLQKENPLPPDGKVSVIISQKDKYK